MNADTEKAQASEPKARIFISYSRKDLAFADRLDAALKARGFETLIDRESIEDLEDWRKRIETLIVRCDTVVFVLSPDAINSPECRIEVEFAAALNKRFAPIVWRVVVDEQVPEALARINRIDFVEAPLDNRVDRLAKALTTDIGWIRKHTEYGEAARRWAASGRPGGLLLRSPVLEEAERWIASRPRSAPAPTEETQAFIAESRRGTTRRRNILTGGLAAGLVIALALAGLAYWQRGIAVEQRQVAEQQRKRAEETLRTATRAARGIAYNFVLERNFATALEAADQVILLAPNDIWPYANRAHALMFAGRTDEARSLYLKYRGRQEVANGKSWETTVLEDFAELRKAGLTDPLMDEIEKLFTSAG